MGGLTVLDWAGRILIGALLVGGIGAGVAFAVRASGDDDPLVVAQLSETATPPAPTDTPAPPTATATALPPTQPPPAEAPPTEAPPTQPPPTEAPPAPTQDTRVAIRDLPAVEEIQLANDGKYVIADRGDGCTWVEHSRVASTDFGEQVVLATDCPVDFSILFRPETGEVFHLVP